MAPNEGLEWLDLSQPEEIKSASKLAEASQSLPLPSEVSEEALLSPSRHLPQILPPQIDIQPPPQRWFEQAQLADPHLYKLRLQAEQLALSSGFDHLICLDDIHIDHHAYQLEAALRALRDMRGRVLLADEVGLGKTIEAGIIMKELLARRLVESVLIITPAPLTWQWHEELTAKFEEEFQVLEHPDQCQNQGQLRWIISIDRASRSTWSRRLLAQEYDLLIIDEAHKLKNHRTRAYRFVNEIRKRYVLMLTATPVHNNLLELYNLITILRPGHLGTRADFRRDFVDRTRPKSQTTRRPPRRTIYSREDAPSYLRKNQKDRQSFLTRNPNFLGETFEQVHSLLAFEQELLLEVGLDQQAQKALDEVKALLNDGYEVFDFEGISYRSWHRKHVDFVCRLKLLPQDDKAKPKAKVVRQKQIQAKNPARLRQILREVMIRNRRTSVGVKLPRREAAIYHLTLSPDEMEIYQIVTEFIREELRRIEQGAVPARRAGALKLQLMSLQKQLTSSPQALARSLTNLYEKIADGRLERALNLAQGIEKGRKVDATQTILSQYPGKFLIFTDYLPTMHSLIETLEAQGESVVPFHGGLDAQERIEAVRHFRDTARVMISTQSGGEGQNLQFCHQLINYDLPWNPMRIEQRIGRLHRLGQKNTVRIFNLSANDTIEAQIIDLLSHKIRMFELVIGELDLILGELDDQASLEDLLNDSWATSYSEAELLAKIEALEAMIATAHLSYEHVKAASDELAHFLETED